MRFLNFQLALALLLPAAVLADPGEDPYLWLEEIEGEEALAWVTERSAGDQATLEAVPEFGRPASAWNGGDAKAEARLLSSSTRATIRKQARKAVSDSGLEAARSSVFVMLAAKYGINLATVEFLAEGPSVGALVHA